MLVSRRLDDQRYDEIVAEAEGRLPWLCPVWTDHNAHDPGITILELMAWYKEMQQYQMDRLTPAIQQKLLELAGLRLRPAQPARCALEIPPEAPPRPALARLATLEEACFELAEPIPARRPRLERVLVARGGGRVDVSGLAADGTPFQPFAFGGTADTSLLLGFGQKPEETLRLWFQVHQPDGVQRNPPDRQARLPRTLCWEMEGAGPVEPLQDETWALSWSGYVTLPAPEAWQAGEDGLWWLRLRQTEGGCEEQVRLSGLSAGRYRALQQETRAASYFFTVNGQAGCRVQIASAQARKADLAVFLRDGTGWQQTGRYEAHAAAQGLELEVDAAGAALDGEDNLLVVCQDPDHPGEMVFDAKGRPGEQFQLRVEGQEVLTDRLTLLCMTLQQDGSVRPALWHWVEELSVCGPRDRVFTYDPRREIITFGDGLHGAVVMPGPGAVLVTGLVLSRCSGGNIPADSLLAFQEDGTRVEHSAAWGGREAETLAQGRARLLAELNRTRKCLSAEDYERCARQTPGLRLAGARALPGYDPDAPQQRHSAYVSVVVLPAGEGRRPQADRRFLDAVDRQLERCRSICVQARTIAAQYVPFSLTGRLTAAPGTSQEMVRRALEEYFAPCQQRIGAPGCPGELAAALQKLPGIFRIEQLELRGMDQRSYRNAAGDLVIPPDGILALERVELELRRP